MKLLMILHEGFITVAHKIETSLKFDLKNRGDTMKKLLSDYKDEKVDELIREALKEEVENIYVPNKMKEEIDAIIERKMHYEKKCK